MVDYSKNPFLTAVDKLLEQHTGTPTIATMQGGGSVRQYGNLKKILLQCHRSDSCIAALAPLFKLPVLEIVVAKGFEEPSEQEHWTWDPSIFGPEQSSKVNSLELHGVSLENMNLDALIVMLKACKALKALTIDKVRLVQGKYSKDDRFGSFPMGSTLDLPHLKSVLERSKDTLGFLNLCGIQLWPLFRWNPMGSLAEFKKLEYLRADAHVFYKQRPETWRGDRHDWPLLSSLLPSDI
jgi:hypothetical protein